MEHNGPNMGRAILIGQRYCEHCLKAAKFNLDTGRPAKLKYISDGPTSESKIAEYSHTEKPSMPVIATKLGDRLFFNRLPWGPEEMRGAMEEFTNPREAVTDVLSKLANGVIRMIGRPKRDKDNGGTDGK